MKSLSNSKSIGIAEALLALKLCFPLDLWSLQGVGRTCVITAYTLIYTSLLIILWGPQLACANVPPLLEPCAENKRNHFRFHPTYSLCVWGSGFGHGNLAASHSSPEQSGYFWHFSDGGFQCLFLTIKAEQFLSSYCVLITAGTALFLFLSFSSSVFS